MVEREAKTEEETVITGRAVRVGNEMVTPTQGISLGAGAEIERETGKRGVKIETEIDSETMITIEAEIMDMSMTGTGTETETGTDTEIGSKKFTFLYSHCDIRDIKNRFNGLCFICPLLVYLLFWPLFPFEIIEIFCGSFIFSVKYGLAEFRHGLKQGYLICLCFGIQNLNLAT